MWQLYRELLALRRNTPALRNLDLSKVETHADDAKQVLVLRRDDTLTAFNFSDAAQTVDVPAGNWKALLGTGAKIDGAHLTLPPHSFAVWSS